uniref:hypothetical protein n=1 Tax=Marinobacterium profundum TaxID=1714300 RepID=UPI000834A31A|nr:hypothetical protein [Marinobacterium profundum]
MAKVTIELEDVQDDNGISRVLTRVCWHTRAPLNLPTKAENFALAVALVVDGMSAAAPANRPLTTGAKQ